MSRRILLTPELIIQRCREKHGDVYEYLPFDYVTGVNKVTDKLTVRCKVHDLIFTPSISNHMRGSGCPECGRINARHNTRKGRDYYITRAIEVHGDKYDYHMWEDVDNGTFDKVTIVCRKHGPFQQTPNDHISRKAGCPKCGRERILQSRQNDMRLHLTDKSRTLFESSEWLYEEHVNKNRTIIDMANELGVTDSTMGKQLRRHNVPIQYNHDGRSLGERQLYDYVATLAPDARSSDRDLIGPKELDIVIPSHKLAIEYGGLYWHSEVHKNAEYHKSKMDEANAAGYRLITIFEDEWNNRSDHIKTKLQHILGLSPTRVYARKCTIVDVSSIDKKAFLDRYHIQGNGPSSIQYGLEYEGEIVAVIAFIAKQNGTYTLNRYATSVTVPGGFSKLLKHAITTLPNVSRIETFADLRWSEGHLYESTGFDKEYVIPPDYYWTDGITRWHKFGFRHQLLETKLDDYDPTLTEVENCHNHGLYRIYDCGKVKYVLTI